MEAALSIYLENFATTLGSREQLAIGEFANAVLVLPKTLAVNAAKDATELVAGLRWVGGWVGGGGATRRGLAVGGGREGAEGGGEGR